jgi:hypothetical protein
MQHQRAQITREISQMIDRPRSDIPRRVRAPASAFDGCDVSPSWTDRPSISAAFYHTVAPALR